MGDIWFLALIVFFAYTFTLGLSDSNKTAEAQTIQNHIRLGPIVDLLEDIIDNQEDLIELQKETIETLERIKDRK
jgi:hypothetical protein